MTDKTEKKCKQCGEIKPLTDYYIAISNTHIRHPRCKPCHNKFRNRNKVKKVRGFLALDEQIQNNIIEMLKAPKRNKLKKIASDNNIAYTTFLQWYHSGQIPI